MAAMNEARSALAEAREDLLAKPNVVAAGVGYKRVAGQPTDELAVIASVEAKVPKEDLSSSERVPPSLAGVPTDVVASGPIFALQAPTGRFRPAPGGVSIGHVAVTAGTLGCLVRKGGRLLILSNNHVLANSNDARAGDAILQPGRADGGRDPQDRIARLDAFVPIAYDEADDGGGGGGGGPSPCAIGNAVADALNALAGAVGSGTRLRAVKVAPAPAPAAARNLVDAALAEPLDPADVDFDILGIGAISGLAEGILGMAVKKSGRTTGLTTGFIQQIDVTARVSYGVGRSATFVDQLLAGPISQGGDSGSAVLSEDGRLVGLLFAGSTTTTIINRIQNVFQLLQVALP